MGKRVIDDNTLKAIADDIRRRTGTDDLLKPTEIPEYIDIAEDRAYRQGCDDGEFWISETVVAPARDKLSTRVASQLDHDGSLNEWVDKAIADFDSIEAAIEARGVDVPYNNTSVMGELVNEACVTANGIGYETGKNEGVAEGRQAQYDEFWDSYQNKGSRPFLRLFCSIGWNDTTFKPKYSMKYASGANGMFAESRITDLQAILDRQGVTFDFSSCQSFANLLQDSTITRIGVVSTVSGAVTNIFYLAKSLETVDLLILKSNGSQTFSGSFQDCIALANITIEGVIGQNIDIHWSPLTKDSITSIINALSTTATGKTLTLKKTAVDNAFEASEGLADGSTSDEWTSLLGTKTNWTISLV